tara:strand:- start:319 stop:468 length:150 start_codon:yes stop_codon:yes gene_type:complete
VSRAVIQNAAIKSAHKEIKVHEWRVSDVFDENTDLKIIGYRTKVVIMVM